MYRKMLEDGKAKGVTTEKMMWQGVEDVEVLLDIIKDEHPDLYWRFIKRQHEHLFGCHYNENFGMWRIEQMHYKDKQGVVHHAPHWTKDQHKAAYESVKAKIPSSYNMYDFAVALEAEYSDLVCLYKQWWPEATEAQIETKIIESAVNYLNDDDDPECKVWRRYEK